MEHRGRGTITLPKARAALQLDPTRFERLDQILCPILGTDDVVTYMGRLTAVPVDIEEGIEGGHSIGLRRRNGQSLRDVAERSSTDRTGGVLNCMQGRQQHVTLGPCRVSAVRDSAVELLQRAEQLVHRSTLGLGWPLEHRP